MLGLPGSIVAPMAKGAGVVVVADGSEAHAVVDVGLRVLAGSQ